MKHVSKFNDFMKNTVNLNQSRIDTLTSRVEVIDRFLKNDEVFKEFYIETGLQGSYAHRTIIKPSPKSPEFDADLMLYMNENKEWEPKDYLEELYKQLKGNSNYKNIVGRRTRCVTLDYASEFHLDIVPCIIREGFLDEKEYHVCNRNENVEEITDPKGYTEWFQDKNRQVGNNYLIKTVRLIKYLRDIKQTFSCKSILLTTILANQVGGLDDLFEEYDDLPNTLKIIINKLTTYLQDNVAMPTVFNPVNDEESFNRHWDQDKYTNFRAQIKKYNDWINDAYGETDQAESLKKWQKVFGDEFGKLVAGKSATIKQTTNLPIPSHALPPPWPVYNLVTLNLRVTVHKKGNPSDVIALIGKSVGPKVPKGCTVRMEYMGRVSPTHEIHWQVVNTGKEAASIKGGLRGGFYRDSNVRNETTQYTGIHYIECFLVDKKKKVCTARSGRYFINIE